MTFVACPACDAVFDHGKLILSSEQYVDLEWASATQTANTGFAPNHGNDPGAVDDPFRRVVVGARVVAADLGVPVIEP